MIKLASILAKVQVRASLYEKSSEVTSGHKVARRTILVMMVKPPIPNTITAPSFSAKRSRSFHITRAGIRINTISLAVFVTAVARYAPGRLMQDPSVIEGVQFFSMGLHAKRSARVSATLYPTITKPTI